MDSRQRFGCKLYIWEDDPRNISRECGSGPRKRWAGYLCELSPREAGGTSAFMHLGTHLPLPISVGGGSTLLPRTAQPQEALRQKGRGQRPQRELPGGHCEDLGLCPPEGSSGPPSSPRRPLWPCLALLTREDWETGAGTSGKTEANRDHPHAPDCSGGERLNAPPLWVSRLLECGWPRDADSDLQWDAADLHDHGHVLLPLRASVSSSEEGDC